MIVKDLLFAILESTQKEKYPDLHLNSWLQPRVRNHNWEIVKLEKIVIWENEIDSPILTKEIMKNIIIELVWYNWMDKFMEHLELDSSYQYLDRDKYRVNCYMDFNWFNVALRIIPKNIPTLEELNLWETIKNLCSKSKWLILMTWPTWSWKSTNLASMIDYINNNFKKHIITIEDPVEFVFESNKSLINQREIWNHTLWFPQAIKASLREDPDIIMVWEMRDPETIKAVLTLAETWHLVLSTLHTNDTVSAIDRIIDVFPSGQQEQIRMQLSMNLLWVMTQRLLPKVDWTWRIPAREILLNNDAIKNLIITWKTHLIYSIIEISAKNWMILMDKYLVFLYNKNIISKDTLLSYVRDKDWVEMLISE